MRVGLLFFWNTFSIASGVGDDRCWSNGFDYDRCCRQMLVSCWDDIWTYDRCCCADPLHWRHLLPQVVGDMNLEVSGEIYQFGVFNGFSMTILRKMFPEHRLWGFDSFSGMPWDAQDVRQTSFRIGALKPTKSVTDLMHDLGGPQQVGFVQGFFNESLTPGLRQSRGMGQAFYIDIDVDLYTSAFQALDWLFTSGVIRVGTIIGYDDWWVNSCSRGGEDLSSMDTSEGRAHQDISRKHGVRFRCAAGPCRFQPEEAMCWCSWGPIFVVEAIGDAVPDTGFEMSSIDEKNWRSLNPACNKIYSTEHRWKVTRPLKWKGTITNPPEQARTYSSIWGDDAIGQGHARSMLDSAQAWSPKTNKIGEWMQIDLGAVKAVAGTVVQGRNDGWGQRVTRYTVQCSIDQNVWVDVPGVFNGNIDGSSKMQVEFPDPIKARYVRLVVQGWFNHIAMRAAVLERYPSPD